MKKTDVVVVTRHSALVEWLKMQGLITGDEPVVEHATSNDVRGKHVIGVLPLHLAAEAASVTVVDLDLPPEKRGEELSVADMDLYVVSITTYRVTVVKRNEAKGRAEPGIEVAEGDVVAIDGETFMVAEVLGEVDGGGVEVALEDDSEWIIFASREAAGRAARAYWADLAVNDPLDFRALTGDDVLAAWALGVPAGPGSALVKSLGEWLDLWLDAPEDEFARYDGIERAGVLEHAGQKTPCVLYRSD